MIGVLLRLMNCKPFRSRRAGPEEILAMEVADWLRAETLEGRLRATWTCIPHEVGYISQKSAGSALAMMRYAKAKAMGFIPGSTDYVFVWEGGGGWLELKSSAGSLSPEQKDFRDWAVAMRCGHAVCRSLDDVRQKLFEWGVLQT